MDGRLEREFQLDGTKLVANDDVDEILKLHDAWAAKVERHEHGWTVTVSQSHKSLRAKEHTSH